MAFRRNGDSKKRLSIVDDDAAELVVDQAQTAPPEPPSIVNDTSSTSFADVAQQTRSLIHELQRELATRRSSGSTAPAQASTATSTAARTTVSPAIDSPEPSPEDLERELQQYFGQSPDGTADEKPSASTVLEGIRERVIEGVVERILREWNQPGGAAASALQREVTERLIQRVIQGLGTKS